MAFLSHILTEGDPTQPEADIGKGTGMPSTRGKREMDGRLIVPAETCEEIGLGLGEAAVLEVVEGELRIQPLSQTIEQVQTVFRRHVPKGVALADELIADRWREGEAE